jgi:hypothetical protein
LKWPARFLRKEKFFNSNSTLDFDVGRNDLLAPDPSRQSLIEMGDEAIPHLLPLLDLPLQNDGNDVGEVEPEFQNNVTVVAAVASLLGKLRAEAAVSKLQALAATDWSEVPQNALVEGNTRGSLRVAESSCLARRGSCQH